MAGDVDYSEKKDYLDTHFVTASVGYIDNLDVPYYSIRLGGEVGPQGNLYFQVLGFTKDETFAFDGGSASQNYDFITYGIGYEHLFPVSEKAAFTLNVSAGGVYGNYDWAIDGQPVDSLQGNAFSADGGLGFKYWLTENWVLGVAGRLFWLGDYKDGGFTDSSGQDYYWELKHRDIYYGAELGLTYRF